VRVAVGTLVLLLLAAPAVADEAINEGVMKGLAEIEAWDPAAAHEIADELAARAPDDVAVQVLLAQVKLEEGDYAGALAILEKLQKAGHPPDPELFALIKATKKEMEGYTTRESEHFVLFYKPGRDAVLAPYALEALEKQRAALSQQLGYAPPGKVRIEVLEDARALSHVSTLTLEQIHTSGTIALCKFDRLMFISPKALARGYDWLDTIAHEYTHFVVSKMSRNTVPIWIHEGLAKFYESSWRGAPGLGISPPSLALLSEALKKNKLIPFDRMHPSMALLPSQEDAALAFAEVFTAVEYLYGKGGRALLVKIIDNLKGGERYDASVGKAVGTSFARFQSDWMGYLARRDFPRETLPLSAEKLRFKEDAKGPEADKAKDPKREEEIRFGDFLEIQDLDGRKLAHLGELLRIRNHFPGAVEEFQKAYVRVGSRSPALSNRYAQALIKTGDLPKAEQILQASLKPFPGDPRTQLHLGEIYLSSKRWNEAERAFLEVIGVDPFDPLPHAELVKIYGDRKDEERKTREVYVVGVLVGRLDDMPKADKGTIVVHCRPLAHVIVDGVDSGITTPAQIKVPPGSHVVRLVNEERGFTRDEAVEIGAGEEKKIDVVIDSPSPQVPASRAE